MTTTISGDSGLVFPNSSSQSTAEVGMKNRIIDGGFIINQRGYTSGTSLSSGSYAHDRWKAGSGGCTYTFTQGSLGVNTTITITAGSLQQVIEGCNLPEGGTYTLSWTGTAQARFNGGSYGASPLAVTGITAGANTTIEFNTGTVGSVQLEVGSSATSFDYRPYGAELALCQRYCWVNYPATNTPMSMGGVFQTSSQFLGPYQYPVTMRSAPTITYTSSAANYGVVSNSVFTASSLSYGSASVNQAILIIGVSGATAGYSGYLQNQGSGPWAITASAEL
jgi:hypothetical protein